MVDHRPARRALRKGAVATAVLGAPAALAGEGSSADAALLDLGREMNQLHAEEVALNAEWHRLARVAEAMTSPPSPELLACTQQGQPLFTETSPGVFQLSGHAETALRLAHSCFNGGPYPIARNVAHLVAHLDRWKAGAQEAERASGYKAVGEAHDRAREALLALTERTICMPASTPAGIRVKLRALERLFDGDFGEALEQGITPPHWMQLALDERLVCSALADALRILDIGNALF